MIHCFINGRFIENNLFAKFMDKIKENLEGTQSNQLLHGIAPFYIFKLIISNSFNKNINI